MNISKVHVELTGEDILSIINEFLKIDGLDISKVAISQEIEITGCYTNKISIDFKISVSSLQSAYINSLTLSIISSSLNPSEL